MYVQTLLDFKGKYIGWAEKRFEVDWGKSFAGPYQVHFQSLSIPLSLSISPQCKMAYRKPWGRIFRIVIHIFTIKGQCHEIFVCWFFHQKAPLGLIIGTMVRFQFFSLRKFAEIFAKKSPQQCMIHHGRVTPWCIIHCGMPTRWCILHCKKLTPRR